MIAEFYGLPGSGKSTLVEALTQQEDGILKKKRKGSSIPRSGHIRNALKPEFWGFALRACMLLAVKKTRWKPDRMCLRVMLKLYLIYMWERDHGGAEYRCFDHGIVQSIISLVWMDYQLEERALALIAYFCRHMASGVRLVYTCNGDLEEICRRVLERPDNKRIKRSLTPEQMMGLLNFEQRFFERTYIAAEGCGMGLRIDTAQTQEECVCALREALQV